MHKRFFVFYFSLLVIINLTQGKFGILIDIKYKINKKLVGAWWVTREESLGSQTLPFVKGLESSQQLLHSSTTRVDYWSPVWRGGLFSYIFSFLLDFHAQPFKLSKQTFNMFWSLLFWLLYVIFVIIYKKKRFFFNSILLRFFHLSDWVLIYFFVIYFILDNF